jgi:hypothetical protein
MLEAELGLVSGLAYMPMPLAAERGAGWMALALVPTARIELATY